MKNEEELRERLAKLEHEQWEHWSKTLAEQLEEVLAVIEELGGKGLSTYEELEARLKRWKEYWKPYEELDEKTKEFDRIWADKVLRIVNSRWKVKQ